MRKEKKRKEARVGRRRKRSEEWCVADVVVNGGVGGGGGGVGGVKRDEERIFYSLNECGFGLQGLVKGLVFRLRPFCAFCHSNFFPVQPLFSSPTLFSFQHGRAKDILKPLRLDHSYAGFMS